MGHIKFKLKPKDEKRCATHWQDYAKEVCEEFNIKNNKQGKWQTMIFNKAKNGMIDLKSKVDYCHERGIKKGNYLVAMCRKSKH